MLHQCLIPDPSGEYAYMEYIEDLLEIITRLVYYTPGTSQHHPVAKIEA